MSEEVPTGVLKSGKSAYQEAAASHSSAGQFHGRENDAASLISGGVKSRSADWAKGVPPAATESNPVHGRENDASSAVKGVSIKDMKSLWAGQAGGASQFQGRENDAASAIKPGGIKDRVGQWQKKDAPVNEFQGRENDAAAAVAASKVKEMTSVWTGGVGDKKSEWVGRENDAAKFSRTSQSE